MKSTPVRNGNQHHRFEKACFPKDFGPHFLITVDTEEEFDWAAPFARDAYRLEQFPQLARFQEFCEYENVAPIYLVDWPISHSDEAAEILSPALQAGRAEIGIQLHPWVNPPFEEAVTRYNSFAGNLPAALEQAKLENLIEAIETKLGAKPIIYRAGRYGFGENTIDALTANGVTIDTSIRPHFDYSHDGGPDYRNYPSHPFWLNEDHSLLELPLTSVFWGMLRKQGPVLHPLAERFPLLGGAMSRLALLERIPLTPEGITADEAIRAIDMALDEELPLLVFAFHSSSLLPGSTSYISNERDLEHFYGWWRRIFAYLEQRNVTPCSLSEITDAVLR
ncbi:polysaccharide deacetylase family protein [Altericroceibacterium endophyticum]|uniref:WalW protein n=1 Tax=Altericroceibacterium endophyticum TaxID=1808508 RepID=A0A6I4SZQ3_9SPHN|nr:polysaccharide deacetylase family protein [Altericroceibacterium endophyticum]MXO64294.1 WalW protein [Altericroceibacterium endophyticum]